MEQEPVTGYERTVQVPAGRVRLEASLYIPDQARGLVLFAHGSGSSRHSSRNRFVARVLQDGGLGTLLIDLLTAAEERIDNQTRALRFDIAMLAERLVDAATWLSREPDTRNLAIGCFGASTGGGAALVAAAQAPDHIKAVVSRGGRPDLAGPALAKVQAPTLLIVGGDDHAVIRMNEEAFVQLRCPKQMRVIPGATHLFEEPGTLEQVAQLTRDWFTQTLDG